VKAATLDAEVVASRLMADGLGVMAQARLAYLEASAADARASLARESTELWGRLRTIADARLREGDISEVEARSVRGEAAMAEAFARSAKGDQELARIGPTFAPPSWQSKRRALVSASSVRRS
jgi:outer membrane protein TolC